MPVRMNIAWLIGGFALCVAVRAMAAEGEFKSIFDGKSLTGWDGDVSLDDLRQKGVAFGIDISGPNGQNPSTIWLQGFDDNYKLRD